MLVDVERPYKDIETMSLQQAISMFDLADYEVENLTNGKVVWVGDIGLSIAEEEEQ